MLKEDVLAHFKTKSAIVKALGRHKSAIHQWGDVVPLMAALELEAITEGKLKVDISLYTHEGWAIKPEQSTQ